MSDHASPLLLSHPELPGPRIDAVPSYFAMPGNHAPSKRTFRGDLCSFVLDAQLCHDLHEIAQAHGTRVDCVLLAGFGLLLYRYSHQEKISIGCVLSRTLEKTAGTEEPLVLDPEFHEGMNFLDLLKSLEREIQGTVPHDQRSFVGLCNVAFRFDHQDTVPVTQTNGASSLPAGNAASRHSDDDQIAMSTIVDQPIEFDVELRFTENYSNIVGQFHYRPDIFAAETIAQMVGHFCQLLHAIPCSADTKIGELPMLVHAERQQALVEWNRTTSEYPREKCLQEIFQEQVAHAPNAVAAVFDGHDVSYEELNRRANQWAHVLREQGADTEVAVGVCLGPSLDLVIALLAIVKAGGAYVPLDPGYPPERLAFMLQNAGIAMVVTRQKMLEDLPLLGTVPVLCVDGPAWRERTSRSSECDLQVAMDAENLAQVIYTSGSTGRPKGVAISHRSINRLVLNTDYVQLGPGDRIAQVSNVSFDALTFELWGSLLTGATLVEIQRDVTLDPQQFSQALRQQKITTMLVTTALFNQIVYVMPEAFNSLQNVLIGGEAADVHAIRRVLRTGATSRLLNIYGPTESTTIATWHWAEEVPEGAGTVPIGKPIKNTTTYVLDGYGQPVPIGVVGELYIGGDGLARGYVNRADLTAERFVPDPYSEVGGQRLYRTGDLVRYQRQGVLEFVGRNDHQVKIRGFRIELGEIEAALHECPGVHEAVVVVREDQPGEKVLVAYVVSKGPVSREVTGRLRERLPQYMVPAHVVVLEKLPLSPNGKVDRKRLPEPEKSDIEGYVAPRTATEEILAGIWSDVLRTNRIGIHDNFFALGGHSLLAMQVSFRIREAFGTQPTVREFFEGPTVMELAERIALANVKAQPLQMPELQAIVHKEDLPLSYAQQRLWFLYQFEPDRAQYNICMAVRFSGPLEVSVLGKAINEIVRRHEALRTCFGLQRGVPVQVIHPAQPLEIATIDLRHYGPYQRKAELDRLIVEQAGLAFDLTCAPLLRGVLVQLEAQEHELVLTLHHIVGDGWSMEVLLRELAELYEVFAKGEGPSLPELPIQYADYAVWQRKWLQEGVEQEQLAYWKTQLANLPPALELPGAARDQAGPRNSEGAELHFSMPRELLTKLRHLSCQNGMTLYMTLLAAFQILLHRYSGEQRVVVATPIAGRTRRETEGLIGFFVNTLLLHTDLGGNPTVLELLKRVRTTALGAYANQDLPFERLVEELHPERDLSGTPLAQVMFALQDGNEQEWTMAGVKATGRDIPNGRALFDLTLTFVETERDLAGVIEYRKDLLRAQAVRRIADHLTIILTQVAECPAAKIEELDLLTLPERFQLVEEWNETAIQYSATCVQELLEEQVRRTPDAVALVCESREVSYRELNRQVNQLGHYLKMLGVGPEKRVGLYLERSPEKVIAMLGVLKAGGAYVPLDAGYPSERLGHMLEDAQPLVVLTRRELQKTLPQSNAKIVLIDAQQSEICLQPEDDPKQHSAEDHLAYIIYTSGSTGKPKGVAIQHGALSNQLFWSAQAMRLTENDRVLQKASFSFDVSVVESLLPLVTGAQVVMARPGGEREADYLLDLIQEYKITYIDVTPSLLQVLLRSPELGRCKSLRLITCGGEALPSALARQVSESLGSVAVWNAYGPTETTVQSTIAQVAETVSIGRPIANTQVYVLDGQLQPVPLQVAGELYIGGAGLARGYWQRPDLTAERFVPNVFAQSGGERLYRTGDRVRWNADGSLEFLGRIDQQVKVRGFRIELGEVDAALEGHEGVGQAVVVVREDQSGEKRLVGYVVPGTGAELHTGALREYLKKKLPDHMVPSDFVYLEKLPVTPNGKIDRKALPAPACTEFEEHVILRTPIEEMLASIWLEVLRLDHVNIHDNFFELGGHSLLAMQVISRIRDVFNVELPVRKLFEHPTIAALATNIDAALKNGSLAQAPPLVHAEASGDLPLSFAQQRLWFLYQLEPDQALYNIPLVVRLTGTLQASVLNKALSEILRRHESLRTSFRSDNGNPLQAICPPQDFKVPVVDLCQHSKEEREAEAAYRIREQARTPFDLACSPLLRGLLLRLEVEEHVLVLVFHHIASDGWSVGIFQEELAALYQAFASGQAPPLQELPIQYTDYALWQRQWLRSGVEEQQLTYWKKQLAGAPQSLELSMASARPPVQSHRGAEHHFNISPQLLKSLHALGRAEGVTLFMTLLSAFQLLLYRYARQDDIVVGTPIAGRTVHETEGLIGFFVNTLVLRTDLSGNPTFLALLKRVREVALGAYANQDVPFERLVEELQPERNVGRSPLFQIMFVVQNAPTSEWALEGMTLKQERVELGSEKFDLTAHFTEDETGLHAIFSYSTDIFEEHAVRQMGNHYEVLLAQIAAAPHQHIDDLQLLRPDEHQQVLAGQRQTVTPYERNLCVHQLFQAQAECTPSAVALAFAGEQMTYQELNQKSNQVAHYLTHFGVRSEVPVGICMERSLEMVVALLAVLKAGGAYVPLDPTYPRQRLAYMLQDSGVRVLLTQSKWQNILPEHQANILCIDREWPQISQQSQLNPEQPITPENLMYVMYTSGSTGRPKGTAVVHRSVVRLVRNTTYADFGGDQVFLQLAPIAFDASTFEIWGSLLNGARLEIMPAAPLTFEGLADMIKQRGVTSLWLTAGLFHQMVDHQLESLQSLRQLLAGGDVLSPQHVKRFLEQNKATRLINGYGPTENTTFTCCYPVPEAFSATNVPIGTPIANTQVYVLDNAMQPVPAGITGELYTGGDGLARGYLNRTEWTAEKFVPNPFSELPGQRLYRTGDLVRRNRDGVLEFVGRIDDQVKMLGFRIEPREIEAVLSEYEAIEAALVVVEQDQSGAKRLVACVVLKPGHTLETSDVRSMLKQRLPDYMVPSAWVCLDRLPLTASGKIDRNAIRQATTNLPGVPVTTPPRTPVEELLAAIWAEVLQVERIGVHDNFFESGGHSLLAMQIIARLRQVFPVVLPLRVLFERPTVADLSEFFIAHELKPGLTVKIAEAFNRAKN